MTRRIAVAVSSRVSLRWRRGSHWCDGRDGGDESGRERARVDCALWTVENDFPSVPRFIRISIPRIGFRSIFRHAKNKGAPAARQVYAF